MKLIKTYENNPIPNHVICKRCWKTYDKTFGYTDIDTDTRVEYYCDDCVNLCYRRRIISLTKKEV